MFSTRLAFAYSIAQGFGNQPFTPIRCLAEPEKKLFKPMLNQRVKYEDWGKVYSMCPDSKRRSECLLVLIKRVLLEDPINLNLLKSLLNSITEKEIYSEAWRNASDTLGEKTLLSIQVSDR